MNDVMIKSFKILDLSPTATYADAKQSYIDLLKIWHPDKHPQNSKLWEKANTKCQDINAAWIIVEQFINERSFVESDVEPRRKRDAHNESFTYSYKKYSEAEKRVKKNKIKDAIVSSEMHLLYNVVLLLLALLIVIGLRSVLSNYFGLFYYVFTVIVIGYLYSRLRENLQALSNQKQKCDELV